MTLLPFRCRFDESLLQESAAGRLDRGKAALVHDHLEGCADCRETLTFLSLREHLVPSAAPPVPAAILQGFQDDVMAEVRSQARPGSSRMVGVGASLAAALLIGLSLFIGLAPKPPSGTVASVPGAKTGIVAIETPLSGFFASPDQDVVMIVVDTDEEL